MAGVAAPAADAVATFISLTPSFSLSLIGIGFIGGLLSGFLGSGGAFIMTPAMMSLGVPGIMAVAANITHKFGKAIVGSKKHGEFGNVDKKMGLVMFLALFAGTTLAVEISKGILKAMGQAGSNLYISMMFVIILSGVALFMAKDIKNSRKGIVNDGAKKGGLAQKIKNLNLPPMIYFKVANVRTSLWLALLVGFATGFLAGTIGVGGFIGVPAMIYLLGVPTYVAAGTELFLAIFSGFQGAYMYASAGLTDLRIPLLLYIGSIIGLTLGAIGTRVVKGSQIKLVMTSIIALVAVSRITMVPTYLNEMGKMQLSAATNQLLVNISNIFLFGSGIVGSLLILVWIYNAVRRAKTEERQTGLAESKSM